MKRHAGIVAVKPEKLEEYRRLHADAWPGVLRIIRDCNIRNYSIYFRRLPDGRLYLFSYFEYIGVDFDADMAIMGSDPEIQRWWDVCKPCHEPLSDRSPGSWWAEMDEVFHCD